MELNSSELIEILVLPVHDVVIYPRMVKSLLVSCEKSARCLETALAQEKQLFLTAQKGDISDESKTQNLHLTGTIVAILNTIRFSDGIIKVTVKGKQRACLVELEDKDAFLAAKVKLVEEIESGKRRHEALMRAILNQFKKYISLNDKIPSSVLEDVRNIKDCSFFTDTVAEYMPLNLSDRQQILEIADITKRLQRLLEIIMRESNLFRMESQIQDRIKEKIERRQREFYLIEKSKAITEELSELGGEHVAFDHQETFKEQLELLQKKIDAAKMPKEALEKVKSEFQKLKMIPFMSAEAAPVRTYIEYMVQLPWYQRSKTKRNLSEAQAILDAEHYGLLQVKEPIIEYLAVQSSVSKLKSPILCLVGPPGVGKTSLGRSIARATGRKYVRMALGGVPDEAKIRGHIRTYVGSRPGQLMQKIAKAGVKNPLFLLDEVDKLVSDVRGDPAAALLEVLDPEQNCAFNDHYLEVDYDLSEVMFVATSNSMNIPAPLLDRMEVIRLSGYTENEKLNIAKRHFIAKQFENNRVKEGTLGIEDSAILEIIRCYTREAGVRGLERNISRLCRKSVKKMKLDKSIQKISISAENIREYLGVQKYDYGLAHTENRVGQVTGLAWTEVGGDLLTIEAMAVPGKGKFIYTGSLGEVMQESMKIALSVVRARAEKLGINPSFYEQYDLHVHVPQGATPKDGPSAGIAVCTALISTLTNNPVRSDVAMTGEITLHGQVLSIGGLKEKLLAAHRGGIKVVLIPEENQRDLEEIPDNVKSVLTILPVQKVEEALSFALERAPFSNQLPVAIEPLCSSIQPFNHNTPALQ